MNKSIRTMRFIMSLNFCSPELVPLAECFAEEVESAFSTVPGSSGIANEIAIEQEGKHLYIPVIKENYRFFGYILSFDVKKLKEQKIQAIFGDIAIVTDGSENIFLIDSNPAHNGGIVFAINFENFLNKISLSIAQKEG